MAARLQLWRRLLAEYVGTAFLVTVVVGSGIAAEKLSPGDVGLQLFESAAATGAGLVALILAFGPVSGAHFNPIVSVIDVVFGGLAARDLPAYVAAQLVGAISGSIVANLMFELPAVEWSDRVRSGGGVWLAEVVATVGLLVVIFGVVRSGRTPAAPFAVGAYIGAAYFFTASTSFANPAVTIGRMFTDSFAGIAPSSVAAFVAFQLVGGLLALVLVRAIYPGVADAAPDAVVPPVDFPLESPVDTTASPGQSPHQRRVVIMAEIREPREALSKMAEELCAELPGVFSAQTVERFVFQSFRDLARTSTIPTYLSVLTRKFARERLRALGQTEGSVMKIVPEVLFVCVHNAGRSQAAMALLDHHGQGRVHVRSAGSAPVDRINESVIAVLAERGIDIAAEYPKPLTDEVVRAADVVVTMGCGDACPIYPGKRYLDWQLADPAGQSVDAVRPIIDEIDAKVQGLLAELISAAAST